MKLNYQFVSICLCFLLLSATAKDKPVVKRPKETRKYTTGLTFDGGSFRGVISVVVAEEIEQTIKEYLLDHPEYLPKGSKIKTTDDFVVLLADFFDFMAGVSSGSWASGYLATKGGQGASDKVFSDRSIIRKYGRIVPGEVRGMMVFYNEYGEEFYPGEIRFNYTAPAIQSSLPSLSLNISVLSSFNRSQARDFFPNIEIPGVNTAFFDATGLEETLSLFLGKSKLSDCETFYVVHAYDLMSRRNTYFLNDVLSEEPNTYTTQPNNVNEIRRYPKNAEDYTPNVNVTSNIDFYMADLLRGSSAVPAFHEAHFLTAVDREDKEYLCIDGFVATNNAAIKPLITLLSPPYSMQIEDIAMISLGSGVTVPVNPSTATGAPLGYLLNNEFLSILESGGGENTADHVDFLFYTNPDVKPYQYLRIQIYIDGNTTAGQALASSFAAIPLFEELGEETAKRYGKIIKTWVEDFVFAE